MKSQKTWTYRFEMWVAPTRLPSVWRRKAGGHFVRARVTDPTTGKKREIRKVLPEADERTAFNWLHDERARIKGGIVKEQPQKTRFRVDRCTSLAHRHAAQDRRANGIRSPLPKRRRRLSLRIRTQEGIRCLRRVDRSEEEVHPAGHASNIQRHVPSSQGGGSRHEVDFGTPHRPNEGPLFDGIPRRAAGEHRAGASPREIRNAHPARQQPEWCGEWCGRPAAGSASPSSRRAPREVMRHSRRTCAESGSTISVR